MKKKIKKIPKYNIGTTQVIDPNVSNAIMTKRFTTPTLQNTNQKMASLKQHSMATRSINTGTNVGTMDKVGMGVNTGLDLIETATSGQDVTVAGAAKSTLSGAATGLSVGGPIGAAIGAVVGLAAGTAGRSNSVNYDSNSTNINDIVDEGSGWLKWFGMSDNEMRRTANLVQNHNIGKIQTEQMRSDYYANPNNPVGATALAAEGGVIRKPVNALVSKGELIYDPVKKELSKIPGDKGKANNNDDVYIRLQEGDMVISNSPTMVMSNGKTPAQNLEGLVDNNKNMKAKEAIIKKVVNWQEANRTKPQEYMMYDEGTPSAKDSKQQLAEEIFQRKLERGLLENSFIYRQKDGKFVIQDIEGNRYDIPEMLLPYIQGDDSGYYFGPQTGIAPSAGRWSGSTNFAKQILNTRNISKLKNTATRVLPKNAKSANMSGSRKPVTGTSPEVLGKPKTAQEAVQMARNEGTANMWQRLTSKSGVPQKTLEGPQTWATARGSSNLWETPMALQSGDDIAQAINRAYYLNKALPTAAAVSTMLGGAGTFLAYEATKGEQYPVDAAANVSINNASSTAANSPDVVTNGDVIPTVVEKKTVKKPVSKGTSSRVVTTTTPSPEDTVVRRPIDVEPTKKSSTVIPPTSDVVYGRDGGVRYDYNTPETRVTTETSDTGDTAKKSWGSNWQDNLYRMAVLSQPLWDRAKAEPVNYESPVYKYMPTAIDVSGQLRDADQSYALARYNFANLYPNTGAGMAAGLQAASNKAKRLADIRQYQTNAQNELIGKNVGIYNNWANEHARIMNSVYDKTAANRAAARNISRQNRAAALANYGQMLRDDKANKMERMKFAALTPAIKSTYEDGSAMEIYNLYHELFGG